MTTPTNQSKQEDELLRQISHCLQLHAEARDGILSKYESGKTTFEEYQKEWKGNVDRYSKAIMQLIQLHDEAVEREILKKPNEALRSAYQIAKREGKDTNWDIFTHYLENELEREHKIMYPSTHPNEHGEE